MTRDQQRRAQERAGLSDPTVQAKRFWDRVRSGEIDETKAMLLAYAGEPVAKLACNLREEQLKTKLDNRLPWPPFHYTHGEKIQIFSGIPEQFRSAWRWNERWGGGLGVDDFVRLPLPKKWPKQEGQCWTLVLRLPSLQQTAWRLWRSLVRAVKKNANKNIFRFTRARELGEQFSQLRCRRPYTPGLSWERIDMKSCWPNDRPDADWNLDRLVSKDIAPLAAATQHHRYVLAMDGNTTLPYIQCSELSVALQTIPDDGGDEELDLEQTHMLDEMLGETCLRLFWDSDQLRLTRRSRDIAGYEVALPRVLETLRV